MQEYEDGHNWTSEANNPLETKLKRRSAQLQYELIKRGLIYEISGCLIAKRNFSYAGNTKYRHGVCCRSSCAHLDHILSTC
ncbi:hypothetical protein Golomagni_01535 [Golovinomyces magnicellulatus]|nr:hypothetical protein Golomagni_01535 [Golovinomyces magnicellulatus]